jgi:hypothetical protein
MQCKFDVTNDNDSRRHSHQRKAKRSNVHCPPLTMYFEVVNLKYGKCAVSFSIFSKMYLWKVNRPESRHLHKNCEIGCRFRDEDET